MRAGKVVIGVVGGAAIALAAAQLVPYGPDRSRPSTIVEPAWDDPATRELAVRACFDCHSAETQWPWYAWVAPASWVIRHHVDEGRSMLDFSAWSAPGEEAGEAAEVIREGEMPPGYYLAMHPDARLTAAEAAALAAGLERTVGPRDGD